MRKRHNKTMKGGFLEGITSSLSGLWQKTKQATTDMMGTSNTSSYNYPSSTQSSSYNYQQPNQGYRPYGGKRRTKKMRGGYHDNTPTTGVASHAAPFSGETARPHNWVGGRSRRNRKRRGSRRQKK